ncbi:MAG TPA: hypothetical protein VLL52_16575, partial [Anaerolineae bacterium]|nr:hypothetical protein [Anaerolineae bacterium]
MMNRDVQKRLLVGVAAVVVGAVYLLLSYGQSGLGYPLDDAWIHQTYARNLGEHGVWAYWLGESTSAGSTAPLWTILLALGYWLGVPYLWWSYGLGLASWWVLLWASMRLFRCLWPAWGERDWLLGLVLVGMWPLAWAAVSGMETLLFGGMGMVLLLVYAELGDEP